MDKISVVKRDGTIAPIEIHKIQKMAEFSVQGTNCSAIELQTSLQFAFRDMMKTSYIHQQMIFEAIAKINYKQPQWRLVAGRLQMLEYIKLKNIKLSHDANIDYVDLDKLPFSVFLTAMFNKNKYDRIWFKQLSMETLDSIFKSVVDMNRNYDYFIESVATLQHKFLIEYETPQHMYFVIALIYAQRYFAIRSIKYSTDMLQSRVKRYYDLLSLKKVSLPSVILSELRKPNANLSSCFIGLFPDNLKGIMNVIKDFAMISKKGGGIGGSLDKIRAFKSWLMGRKGLATGVKPLIKVLNDLILYVNQSGVKSGALTLGLSAWHMDIFDFLKVQQIGGEEREKSMDIFLQFVANDTFMEELISDGDWYLFDPYEIKQKYNIDLSKSFGDAFRKDYEFLVESAQTGELELFTRVRAIDLFKETLRTAINRGTPYWFYKDTVNATSNMKDAGTIYNGNLCLTGDTIVEVLIDNKYETSMKLEELEHIVADKSKDVKVKSKNIDTNVIEYQQITDWFLTAKDSEIYEIESENGNVIRCTGDHKIYTKNRGYVMAKELQESDILDEVIYN